MPSERRSRPVPTPGHAVRGSTSGRPLMAALDLLGRRWTLRILWELRDGPLGFRVLQARCDAMSPSVLSDRLRDLRHAGLVIRDDEDRHALTAIGSSLGTAIAPLDKWATQWATGRAAHSGSNSPSSRSKSS